MRRVLLGIATGLMFFAAPAAQKSADDTRPQSNDDLATVLFRQFNRRPEKTKIEFTSRIWV
jgi:hypothetical protein